MNRIAATVCLATTIGTPARAQCELWLDAPANPNWQVRDFAPLGARVALIARYMVDVPLPPPLSGTVPAPRSRVYAFDGNALSGLGGEFGGPFVAPGEAFALKSFAQTSPPFGQELICGGSFTSVGGVNANNIARLSESVIVLPPPAWEPMGDGFDAPVRAIERFNGAIYAAGMFTVSGTAHVNRIARWSGSTWSPLGSGVNGAVYTLRTGGVAPNGIELLVGGDFTSAGGVPANGIARWIVSPIVPGSGSWAAMGAGFNDIVLAIERHSGSTYAAGAFTMAGTAAVNRVARWNGSAWVDVGGGFNGFVQTLISSGGFLYAGGAFTTAGPGAVTARRIARWDGATWTEVLNGAGGGVVLALRPFQTEIHAGGTFPNIGNLPFSAVWARYNPTGVPWITRHPDPQSIACGENAEFFARVASGYTGLPYPWRKDGVPLVNGPTGSGSSITNAGGTTSSSVPPPLTIASASLGDQGTYDYAVLSPCVQGTSNGATLTVTGCCYPDCNASGTLTIADFGCFQSQFAAQDPYADCNASGTFTIADFGCFQSRFAAGCP